MTPEQHEALVQQGIEERRAHLQKIHTCPVCGSNDPILLPLGGPGSYWFEHECGAYSPLKATLEEAIAAPVEEWQKVDSDLNDCMYPPIGG